MMSLITSIYYIIHVYVKEKSICILISNYNDTYITLNCFIKGTTLLHVAINNKTVLKIIN